MQSITSSHNPEPVDGELRALHIPQIPGKSFEVQVASITEGREVLDVLAYYDLFQFENHIKPDYANMGTLVRYVEKDKDWEEVDDED